MVTVEQSGHDVGYILHDFGVVECARDQPPEDRSLLDLVGAEPDRLVQGGVAQAERDLRRDGFHDVDFGLAEPEVGSLGSEQQRSDKLVVLAQRDHEQSLR